MVSQHMHAGVLAQPIRYAITRYLSVHQTLPDSWSEGLELSHGAAVCSILNLLLAILAEIAPTFVGSE